MAPVVQLGVSNMVATIKADVLVLGSGIAGLWYAVRVAENPNLQVVVVTKRTVDESATRYAQGGIAAVLSNEDSIASHMNDTLRSGAGLCDVDIAERFIREGASVVKDLQDLGVEFSPNSIDVANGLDLGKEGGHSNRRVAHVDDMTGNAIQNVIVARARQAPNIRLFEEHMAVNLAQIGGKVVGAYILDTNTLAVKRFQARLTVIATGGAGKAFLYTSNPDVASGDGIAMAHRVGATIANPEFIQFHPTCLYHPVARTFLVSEAVRGEGAILTTMDGHRFMPDYHELAELAPRDIVARAIDNEMKKSGDDHVLLDISFKPSDFVASRFPGIHKVLLSYDIDMTKGPIPIVPAAHYIIGGIKTDVFGQTDVRGLLALGEVTCTGFHGANRLASNSLLEGGVMAKKAAELTPELLQTLSDLIEFPEWELGHATDSDEAVVISHNWDELRRIMWNYVGIFRSTKRLLRAAKRIKVLQEEINQYYWDFVLTADLVELRSLVTFCDLAVQAALFRKESRGTHYNIDHTQQYDVAYDILLQRNLGVFFSNPRPLAFPPGKQ